MILLSYSRQLWHAGPSSLCCLEDIKTPIQATQLFVEKSFFCFLFFFFLWRLFLWLKVYKFYHPMLVLNAFAAISEGLKLKMFRGSMPPDSPRWLTLARSKSTSPRPQIVNFARNSVSDNQSSPSRDLPLRPHLVRLLFRSHLPIKKPSYGPE